MERPNFDFVVKQPRVIMVPTERFLSAEYEYGDISKDLAELKDFHIEMEKQVYEELALENPNPIQSIDTEDERPKKLHRTVTFKDEDQINPYSITK